MYGYQRLREVSVIDGSMVLAQVQTLKRDSVFLGQKITVYEPVGQSVFVFGENGSYLFDRVVCGVLYVFIENPDYPEHHVDPVRRNSGVMWAPLSLGKLHVKDLDSDGQPLPLVVRYGELTEPERLKVLWDIETMPVYVIPKDGPGLFGFVGACHASCLSMLKK
jgi:hypothetical protein